MSHKSPNQPTLDTRAQGLYDWVKQTLGTTDVQIEAASADASFRRYFRIRWQQGGEQLSRIVMDAPPAHEDCRPFVEIAGRIRRAGLNAPKVHAWDEQQGYMLLDDLGSTSYLQQLNDNNAYDLYSAALASLVEMQHRIDPVGLPVYDRPMLMREMALFRDWFLDQLLGLKLSSGEQHLLAHLFERLIDVALEQTFCFVHRDYHSRNLMWMGDDTGPGIIDFQDAVYGPISYDAVSLLRDCYISWAPDLVDLLLMDYHQALWDRDMIKAGQDQFRHWFDRMGMQRHLKAIGIFSRLSLRDGKHDYLKDIPHTMQYLLERCEAYDDTQAFNAFLMDRVMPAMHQRLDGDLA
jgi:hypothetical protein